MVGLGAGVAAKSVDSSRSRISLWQSQEFYSRKMFWCDQDGQEKLRSFYRPVTQIFTE